MHKLDIVIPVYNEGQNISRVLRLLKDNVAIDFRVLICYDDDSDNTLPVAKGVSEELSLKTVFLKNHDRGVFGAVARGFTFSDADAVLVMPADDTENAKIIDIMYEKFKQGHDVVVASRFMKGGCMNGCPWLKSFLVRLASFSLYRLAGIPAKDATNGFRLFSKKLLNTVAIESKRGFTYSLELLVKCHRLCWRITEVPASWRERDQGKSRFKLFEWLPHYLRWYFYGFVTTYLKRSPRTVKLKEDFK